MGALPWQLNHGDDLRRAGEASLPTLPGTAAEILDDPVRAVLCPDKITTDEWLECHRVAHQVGLRSNVTMMFGAVEQPRSWARHLVRTRDLQRQTVSPETDCLVRVRGGSHESVPFVRGIFRGMKAGSGAWTRHRSAGFCLLT